MSEHAFVEDEASRTEIGRMGPLSKDRVVRTHGRMPPNRRQDRLNRSELVLECFLSL